MNAWWRAANYLSVGQIYLLANPLLQDPLSRANIKRAFLGHWGTTPGLNFIYVHMNRVIRQHDLNMIFIASPEHLFLPELIRQRRDELQARFEGRLVLATGCDFHLSFENLQDIRHDADRFTLNQKSYLLVEFADYLDSAVARPGAARAAARRAASDRHAPGAQPADPLAARTSLQMAATGLLRAGHGAVAAREIRERRAGNVAEMARRGSGAFRRKRRAQHDLAPAAPEGNVRPSGENARRSKWLARCWWTIRWRRSRTARFPTCRNFADDVGWENSEGASPRRKKRFFFF